MPIVPPTAHASNAQNGFYNIFLFSNIGEIFTNHAFLILYAQGTTLEPFLEYHKCIDLLTCLIAVRFLLKQGVDPDATNEDGLTALHQVYFQKEKLPEM